MWFVLAEKRERIEQDLDRVEFIYAVCDDEGIAEQLKKECESEEELYTRNEKHPNTYENVRIEKDDKNTRLTNL